MSSRSNAVQNGQPSPSFWQTVAPYAVPPVAGSVAIVPAFADLIAKSALQKGETPPKLSLQSFLQGAKQGVKAAPTIGGIVGAQMGAQKFVEWVGVKLGITKEADKAKLSTKLVSSAAVGVLSSWPLAIFNGQTMGWGWLESTRKFSVKQAAALSLQETGFVLGLSAADPVAAEMKKIFGDNKVVEYTAAFTSGAAGSVVGHPANTAVTRWQSGLPVEWALNLDSLRQSMRGAARKARAVGTFSVGYKFVKDTLNSSVGGSQ